jgi:hypothetical protein
MKRRAAILVALAPALLAGAAAPKGAATYSYPAQARAIPLLRAWLDRQATVARSRLVADMAKERRSGGVVDHFASDRTWQVVTDTPRFLSLSLETYDYSGGAHGNTHFGSLIWDRQRQLRMGAIQFFTGAAALEAAIKQPFCRELNRQREAKRGGPVQPDKIIPEFSGCISPEHATLILGSTDLQRFSRIGILIAPYEAGPYSDG